MYEYEVFLEQRAGRDLKRLEAKEFQRIIPDLLDVVKLPVLKVIGGFGLETTGLFMKLMIKQRSLG